MEKIEETIKGLQAILVDFPADVNTYILLVTLREMLAPIHAKLMLAEDKDSQNACVQVKLISDMAMAIIELINVKKVEIKD